MVDAADLKSYHPSQNHEKLNNNNKLKALTFFRYTYTSLTHFWSCKAQQIFGFMTKSVGAVDAKSVAPKKSDGGV
tara:strand:+ start:274 stop:498 length:225 start_codon:yes stop_codon:yes gene_type:complete